MPILDRFDIIYSMSARLPAADAGEEADIAAGGAYALAMARRMYGPHVQPLTRALAIAKMGKTMWGIGGQPGWPEATSFKGRASQIRPWRMMRESSAGIVVEHDGAELTLTPHGAELTLSSDSVPVFVFYQGKGKGKGKGKDVSVTSPARKSSKCKSSIDKSRSPSKSPTTMLRAHALIADACSKLQRDMGLSHATIIRLVSDWFVGQDCAT